MYSYKSTTRKTYFLSESKDLLIVRTVGNFDPITILENAKFASDFTIELTDEFPEASVFVYKLICQEPDIFREKLKNKINDLEHPKIVFAGTVLQFENGIYQIYTGNIFIKFQSDTSTSEHSSFLKQHNLKTKRETQFCKGGYFVEPIENIGKKIFEFCEKLMDYNITEICQPELVVKRKTLPKTEEKKGDFEDSEWAAAMIRLKEAWNISKGKGVKICIIDDGIDINHPAFKRTNKITASKDMFEENMDAMHKFDSEMHGTACASIACSDDPRAMGVAPEAELIVIRTKGLGSILESEAIYWAVQQGADIISCSWGPRDGNILDPSDDNYDHPIPEHTRLALEYASTYGRGGKGCLIFFAAGNGNEKVANDGYAAYAKVMAIGSVNKNREPTRYTDGGYPLFCCFPSSEIIIRENQIIQIYGLLSADRLGDYGYSEGDYFGKFGGTSASCPGVAGVAALMLSIAPDLEIEVCKAILEQASSIPNEPNLVYHPRYGHGIIDAKKVLDLALGQNINKTDEKPKSFMKTSKSHAVSLHIGLNRVDQDYYKGHVPPLYGCVNDMKTMQEFATSIGFKSYTLEERQATKQNIAARIEELGNSVIDNGIFLISYAGHGAQLQDSNTVENSEFDIEGDFKDESWVTYNGFMLDDEIFNALAAIQTNIRVVLVSDSCHSESMSRMLFFDAQAPNEPVERGLGTLQVRAILEENSQTVADLRSAAGKKDSSFKVAVINLSACLAFQKAKEIQGNGVFTQALVSTYKAYTNKRSIDYEKFISDVKQKVKNRVREQDPNYSRSHIKKESFIRETPFLITKSNNTNDDNQISNNMENHNNNETKEPVTLPRIISTGEVYIEDPSLQEFSTLNTEISGVRDFSNSKGWDRAYLALLTGESAYYCEPHIVSNLFYEGDRNDSGDIGERGTDEYLSTYPWPTEQKDVNNFIWHLGDDFSQLKKAREAVFPELKMGVLSKEKAEVRIAHIDTGLIQFHPSRPLNVIDEVEFKMTGVHLGANDLDQWINPVEQQGHGNGTASILAGGKIDLKHTGNEFQGFFGAIPHAEIVSIKISETVVLLSGHLFASAVDYAIKTNCDVITMSMAGLPSKVMAKAVNRAYEHGIVVVSAASNCWSKGLGNSAPKKTLYPARYDRVIAAVGCTYDKLPYLNHLNSGSDRAAGGKYMQSCYGPQSALPTTVAAYTPNISWFDRTPGSKHNEYYKKTGGGTSSATPQIAAAAALYIQKHKHDLSKYNGSTAWKKAEIVRQAIFNSANKDSDFNKSFFGNGMLKAADALDDKYAPKEMIKNIHKQAKKAPERRRILGGLIHVLRGGGVSRSLDSTKEIDWKLLDGNIQDMVIAEINQVVYLDEKLNIYQELDFEKEAFDLSSHPELIKSLIRSNHVSDTLKEMLTDSFPGTVEYSDSFKSEKFEGAFGDITVRSTSAHFRVLNHKTDKVGFGENAVFMDEFELIVDENRGIRGDLLSELRITLDGAEDMESVLLLEKVYEDTTIYDWQIRKHANPINRGNLKEDFPLDNNEYILYGLSDIDRGFGDQVKRIFVKSFRWIRSKVLKNLIDSTKGDKNKLNQKIDDLIEPLGDGKYEILFFDLEMKITDTNSGWINVEFNPGLKSQLETELQASTQQGKNALLVLPGLFSNVEKGFDDFLESDLVRKSLLEKHSRFVIGFNMPTVLHGIEKNAESLSSMLKKYNFNELPCTVLAKSRGAIVARELFERTWINNNTFKPIKNAPFELKTMCLIAPPNQGTKMASTENWRSLFNTVTNVARLSIGSIAPVVPKILTALKAIGLGMIELDGINDLEENSEILSKLNNLNLKNYRSSYFVIMSNFEPRAVVKRLLDEVVDRKIFHNEANDFVNPVLGAIFKDENQDTIIQLREEQYQILSSNEQVNHFRYLNTKKHENLVMDVLSKLSKQ